jgi:hypothetical protein
MDFLDDPLDKDDFDPVAYINKRFPTGIIHIFNCFAMIKCILRLLQNLLLIS